MFYYKNWFDIKYLKKVYMPLNKPYYTHSYITQHLKLWTKKSWKKFSCIIRNDFLEIVAVEFDWLVGWLDFMAYQPL